MINVNYQTMLYLLYLQEYLFMLVKNNAMKQYVS